METAKPTNTNHDDKEATQFLAKLQALQEVNLELARIATLEDLYHAAIELGRTRLGFDRLGLLLYDETTNMMVGTFGTDDQGEIRDERDFRQTVDEMLLDILSGQEKLGFWENTELRDEGEVVGTGWNAMAVLWSGEKGIGWLAADNHLNHIPLEKRQLDILQLYGTNLGHLVLARQIEQQQAELLELRANQVEISTQVAQAIATTTNLEDLYKQIVTEIKDRFGYYHTQLLRYNPDKDAVELIAGYGDIGAEMLANKHQIPMGQGLIGTATATGESTLRSDLTDDPDWSSNPLLPETKGEIAVPIKLGKEILGVLDIQSDTPHTLGSNDQLLLEGLCGQIAVAINTTRLNEERIQAQEALTQSRETLGETLDRQQVLHDISLELSSIQDLDELYRQVILNARERLGFDRIGLFLVDLDIEELRGTYGINPKGELVSNKHDIFNFSDGNWVKRIVYSEERIFVREDADLLEGQEVIGRGWHLTATMKIRGSLIGIMFADNMVSQQPFQPHLPELLSAYSTDAANLIDRLRSEQRLRDREQTIQEFVERQQALHEIGILLSSIENPKDLYKEAIKLGQTTLGFSRLGLYLLDSDRTTLHGTFGIGIDGTLRNEYDEIHILADEPWMGRFINDNERLSVSEDSDLYEDGVVVGHGWSITAALWSQGMPIGLLFADNLLNPQPLQPYQPELLSAFGATIANLIDQQQANAERIRLLQDTERQAANLSLLNEMSTTLNQAQSIEDVYKIAGDYTLRITNDVRASLALLTPDKQMVELFGLSGVEGVVTLGTKIPVQGSGIGLAIRENRQLYFPEEASMDTYLDTQKMADQGLNSAIVTPLVVGGQSIGSLNVASEIVPDSATQKKTLMQQITSLVASAIQIRQAQERTDTILQSVTLPLLISRVSDGQILYTNAHLADMVKLPLEELIGSQTPNFYVKEADRTSLIQNIQENGYVENHELLLQRDNKEQFWGLLTARLIQFEGTPAIITSVIDITDRREAQAAIIRQASELQIVTDLSTQIAGIEDPQKMLELVVQETQRQFDLYHCHVFLMDDTNKNLRIRACGWHQDAPEYGTHGTTVLSMDSKKSLVVQAASLRQAVIVNDVLDDPNWLPNELLPDTRSEMAVPLIVGNTVLGVLDVQSSETDHFTEADIKIQSTLAAQIAVALENARSTARTQAALAELNDVTRRLTRESWNEYLSDISKAETGYMYDMGELTPVSKEPVAQADEETAVSSPNGHVSHSLMVRGEAIGYLTAFNEAESNELGEDASLIMVAIAEQLSARIENIRLTEQTQQALAQTQDQAQRLGLLNEISAEMSNVDTLNQVFDIIFARIPNLLNVDRVSLAMLQPDGETLEIIGHEGGIVDQTVGTKFPLAGTPMAKVLHENRIITSNQPSPDNVIKSSMIAPIFSAGKAIGTLNIGSKRVNGLTDKEEALLQQLATMLSSVIENKQLLAAAQARAERERQVRTITDRIRRGVDREAILNIAQKEISQLIGATQSTAQLGTKAQLLERIQHSIEQTKQGSD